MKCNLLGFRLLLAMASITCLHHAAASGLPSNACLKPLEEMETPVSPREVQITYFPTAASDTVSVETCYASSLSQIADMNVQVSVFDEDGRFVANGGQSRGALPRKTDTRDPPFVPPAIVDSAGSEFSFPHVAALSAYVLVALVWRPCEETLELGKCTPGSTRTDTFIRKAAITIKRR